MDVNCSLYKRNGKNISICSFDNEMYKCTINFKSRWIYKVPGKTMQNIKIYFCNFVDKIYTIGFNI